MRIWLALILSQAIVMPALGQSEALPVSGQSRLAQFETAPGFMIEVFHRLRSRNAGLHFTESADDRFPALTLTTTGCEVRLEDRNFDGRFDTETSYRSGALAASCPERNPPHFPTSIESGAQTGPTRDCLFQITADYRVQCQPTRFGRVDGEPWDLITGWTDRFGRALIGRPDDLFWHDGLLVLDGPSGILYRISDAPEPTKTEEPTQPQAAAFEEPVPTKPELPTRSRLLTGELPISKERQKVLDDRERTFSRLRDTEKAEDQ